jgi:cell division protein FtsB
MAPGAFVVAITFFIILDLNDFEIAKVRKKVIEFIEILYLCKLKKEYAMTFKEILRKLNNRYIYATLAFLVVILFIDQFNLFEQIRLKKSLKDQKQQIEYYEKELSESKQYLNALQKDTATMEKVAREQYLMKRDNEVIYLIDTQE